MKLRIKEMMTEKGVSSVSLSDIIGVSKVTVSNLINNKTMPSLETLDKIAKALNVEVWELFERTGKTDLTALVEYKEDFYKAETLSGLKEIVKKIELREPGTAESPAMNNNQVKIEVVNQPAESSTREKSLTLNSTPVTEQPKQPDPEPNPIPEPEPPKRTFFPATNYNARPQFRVREGVLIHFGGRQYTRANITDAIALELLRDAPARIKFFDIYPDDWEELLSL